MKNKHFELIRVFNSLSKINNKLNSCSCYFFSQNCFIEIVESYVKIQNVILTSYFKNK